MAESLGQGLLYAPLAPDANAANMDAMAPLRPPQTRFGLETGEQILGYELLEEQAVTLGRLGRKMEAALAALAQHESKDGRAELVRSAAEAVWYFLIQRELMGLRDRAAVVAHYGIPREVLNRIGAR
jgi:hypothetical protein